jgi:hypothetical protein
MITFLRICAPNGLRYQRWDGLAKLNHIMARNLANGEHFAGRVAPSGSILKKDMADRCRVELKMSTMQGFSASHGLEG